MKPTRFDEMTQTLATGLSRRQVFLAICGAIVGRLSESNHAVARPLKQTATPTPETLVGDVPLFVSPDPIPLGGDKYLIDGSIVTLDLEAVPFVAETESIPILIDNETVFINTSTLTGEMPPAATPMAGGEEPPEGGLETICGFDESQDVELYDGTLGVSKAYVADHQPPVGLIRWNTNLLSLYSEPGTVNGRRWCSGTLVAPDLFLTAGHCFSQTPLGYIVPRINGTNDPISRTEIALNMHVDFRYQLDANGNDQVPESFRIIELVEDRLGDLDYAIVRLENYPGLTFGLAGVAQADVAPGDLLCIMGHPEGAPKRIATGPATRLNTVRIEYDNIDTRGGNSGSGILADAHGLIVGVHTNGGCCQELPGNPCPDVPQPGANKGVRISALLNASPILGSLASGGGTPTAKQ
jgi:hypothetical protein